MTNLYCLIIVAALVIVSFICGFVLSRAKTDGILWVENLNPNYLNTTIEIHMPPEKLLMDGVFVLRVKQK